MNKKVSVVVATYNGEKYIIEQLESIKNQTYSYIEVIVVDDRSSDSTVQIVEKFINDNKLHDSWTIQVNENNKGWRKNFIDGMSMCNGDYIFPCDQDDIWLANKIELMVSIMENNENINVLSSNILEFTSDGVFRNVPLKEDGKVKQYLLEKNFFNNLFPGCSFCVRRQFFDRIKKYWWEKEPHDALLWRYAMFDNSLFTVGVSLIKQRVHEDSTYRVESKKNKTHLKKVEEIQYMKKELSNIEYFVEENEELVNVKSHDILNGAKKWLNNREELFAHFNLIRALILLYYLPYYERKRKYILDVLISCQYIK